MIPYLIALTCFLVGIVILVIAPRNLVDNFLFLAGFIILFFAILNDPTFNNHPFFQHVFYWLDRYVRLLAPLFTMIFGIGMISYALKVYRIEKSKLQLTVGLLLAAVLIGGTVFQYVASFFYSTLFHQEVVRVFQFAMAYFVLAFVNYLVVTLRLTLLEDESQQDFVVILGEQLSKDGKPSSVLESRLDMAVDYIERQQFQFQSVPRIIVSGTSTGAESQVSEARIMADYLVDHGVPPEMILLEDQAHNTHENFIYAKGIMQANVKQLKTTKAVFVTSSYHLYRSQLYANMEGLYQISGVGAQATMMERILNWVREFVAIIFMHRKLHLAVSCLMIGLGVINFVHF